MPKRRYYSSGIHTCRAGSAGSETQCKRSADYILNWQSRYLLEIDPACAYMINPGSVGQPRDHDPRAAYVLYDSENETLFYHRVPYDVETAQRKIREAGLPDLLAARLASGR